MEANNINIEDNKNNVYALNREGREIHVSEAESGANGYLCLGCTKELVAVKSILPNRIDYFRHKALEVEIERRCTYSDETHRHKLAKIILLQNKFIKVPPVYKFPPKGSIGLAVNILQESKIIDAYTVKSETTFYEDINGEIKWGSNTEIDERFLFVKPDITFFDESGSPILFIELVATHKVNFEKQVKLKRLGINTIELRLPKESPEAIENSFKTIERTKWIYNHVEESTKYVPISIGNSEGISTLDEEQRGFFEESFKCRTAQINNLIRTATRCLESKQYRNTLQEIGEELSRVKGNTEEHQSRLDSIRTECKNRVFKGFEPQINDLNEELERFEIEERNFNEYYKDLERRYKSKKSELEGEERKINAEIYGTVENDGGIGNSLEKRRRDVEKLTNEIRELIEQEEREISIIEQNEIEQPNIFKEQENAITKEFNSLTEHELDKSKRIDKEKADLPEQFESIEEEFKRTIESEQANLPREFGTKDERIEKEFEGLREQTDEIINKRIINGNSELHRRVRGLLEARKLFNDFREAQILFRRYKKAYESFKNGAYENWEK